jgi:SAM-dependent methyltransferase
VEGLDVDSLARLEVHGRLLARKRLLREVFEEFHALFDRLDRDHLAGAGLRVELGAGVAPIKQSFPDVLATDLVDGPGLDRALDAEAMALPDGSVRVVFCQNCFHHFPHPERFFEELERVLSVGGGAILLEPYHGPLAAFLYRRLFKQEGYDERQASWETPAMGPMNGANQALSFIVFVRDRAAFERRFPRLEIVRLEPVRNHLKYLFSGGLNFRQLWPDEAVPGLTRLQALLAPFDRWLALHHVIVLRKTA